VRNVAQADAWIAELVDRCHRNHVDAGTDRHIGRQQQRIAHLHAVHAVPCAMITVVHTHVAHVEQRGLARRRDRRAGTGAARQRGEREAGAVHAFGDDGIGLGRRRDDHVIGLGGGDLELVDLDRLHVLTVRRDHRHRQARDAQVEEGLGRPVDDPEANALAGPEQELQPLLRPAPVGKIGVGRSGHIRDVGRGHAHLGPHPAVLGRERVIVGPAGLLVVEIALALAQPVHDEVRV